MLVSSPNGEIIAPTAFESELELQDAIHRLPQVLDPVAQLAGLNAPLYLIGREINLGAGPMDFLAVDITGTLHIVETKLAKNPELKRTVIGQVIHYAQQLVDTDYEVLSQKCLPSLGGARGLAEAVHTHFANQVNEGMAEAERLLRAVEYKKAMQASLATGQIAVVIVADKVSLGTHRLFNYLDERTDDRVNFIVLEINRYRIDDREVLHSNVVWAAKYVKARVQQGTRRLQEFLAKLTPHARRLVEFVDEQCENRGLSKAITRRGMSWQGSWGGSIFVNENELQTNWSTLPRHSEALWALRRQTMEEAQTVPGLDLIGGAGGGIKLKLDAATKRETVERFLALAIRVLEKAGEV